MNNMAQQSNRPVSLNPLATRGQVQSQIDGLDAQLIRIEQAVTQLETRLSNVTRGDNPETKAGAQVDEVMVPTADRLRGMGRYTYNLAGRLESILERLEL